MIDYTLEVRYGDFGEHLGEWSIGRHLEWGVKGFSLTVCNRLE